MVSAGLCYVPGGVVPLRDVGFWYVLAEKDSGFVMCRQASCLASQTRFRWDNPKPLKVSGIVLTSAVVSQRRCLLVYCVKSTWLILLDTLTPVRYQFGRRRAARTDYSFVFIHSSSISNPRELQRSTKSS